MPDFFLHFHDCEEFSLDLLTNPHQAVGNGQHLAVAGVVLTAALLSVKLKGTSSSLAIQAPAPKTDPTVLDVAADGRCFWSSLMLHYSSDEYRSEWQRVARNDCGFPICTKRMLLEAGE